MRSQSKNWVIADTDYPCWLEHCRKPILPGDKVIQMVSLGYGISFMHRRHAKHLNFVTRVRLCFAGSPEIRILNMENPKNWTIHARYTAAENVYLLTRDFAELEPAKMVHVLSHETIHWVLSRDGGAIASVQFDALLTRPLRCLGGHSFDHASLLAIEANSRNL